MDLYEEYARPDGRGARHKPKGRGRAAGFALERERQFGDFTCLRCGRPVSADPLRSGVNHRNHCPYCLWSRHMDLWQAGDRLAACKGPMRPVGLTVKRQLKKYAPAQPGELMLAHRCDDCGALSINRVAADDFPARLWDVYEASLAQPGLALAEGITLLEGTQRELVRTRVFGVGAPSAVAG
jgi:hypothetical protein